MREAYKQNTEKERHTHAKCGIESIELAVKREYKVKSFTNTLESVALAAVVAAASTVAAIAAVQPAVAYLPINISYLAKGDATNTF